MQGGDPNAEGTGVIADAAEFAPSALKTVS